MNTTRKITLGQALDLLKEKDGKVHTVRNKISGVLMGANFKLQALVILMLKHKTTLELAGGLARRRKHGIVLQDKKGALFIETDEQALNNFDPIKKVGTINNYCFEITNVSNKPQKAVLFGANNNLMSDNYGSDANILIKSIINKDYRDILYDSMDKCQDILNVEAYATISKVSFYEKEKGMLDRDKRQGYQIIKIHEYFSTGGGKSLEFPMNKKMTDVIEYKSKRQQINQCSQIELSILPKHKIYVSIVTEEFEQHLPKMELIVIKGTDKPKRKIKKKK